MNCCFCEIFDRKCNEEVEVFFNLQVCLYHKKCIVRGLNDKAVDKFVDIMVGACIRGMGILMDEEIEVDKKLTASGWTRRKEIRRNFDKLWITKPKVT